MTEPQPQSNPSPGQATPPHASHVPVHFARRTGLRVAIGVLAVAAGLAAVYLFRSGQTASVQTSLTCQARHEQEQPPVVNVARVAPAQAESPLSLPGQCRALFETTVFARINGYVLKWDYDIGDHVKAGDVLATIDAPELDEQIKVAEAKLDSLRADVKLAQASVDFAKITHVRFAAGAPEGVVSRQEADQKKAELDVSLARLESAQAQVALGQADLRRLQAMADFKRVVAPFDGTITQRHIDIGQLVTAGSTSNTTALFTICRSDQVRVYADVPQVARTNLRVGMPADVTAREFPDRIFHGQMDRTAEAINPASGTLRVEVMVPNPDGLLLPGMFTQVTFRGRQAHPPLRILAGALMALADGPHVAVVGADGCVHFRAIKIARDLGDVIEVAEGLAGNEMLALNISHEITDGQKVSAVTAGAEAVPPPASAIPTAGQASLTAAHGAGS